MKNIAVLVTFFLLSAVSVTILFSFQAFGQQTRSSRVTDCKLWQCPKCGTILEKRGLGKVWNPGDPITRVAGTATCGRCLSRYDQADIYGGLYDSCEKVKQSQIPNYDGPVSVLVFQLFSKNQPSNSRDICQNLLAHRYSKAKLSKFYIVGRSDSITPDEALTQYKEYVRDGKLPDLGTQFDTLTGKDISGKEAVVLFFK
jgi:hypothetical protein